MYKIEFIGDIWRVIYASSLNHAAKIANARARKEGWVVVGVYPMDGELV